MLVVGLTVVIPIAFAFGLPLYSKIVKGNRAAISSYAILGSLITLILSALVARGAYISSKPLVYVFGKWVAPVGIVYEVDLLSAVIALVSAFLMFMIAIYSHQYLKHESGIEWYYTLYLGLEAGLMGVFYTGDAFNLFVMIEVTSIAAYGLVMFYRSRGDSVVAGLKYAIIGSTATTVYFLAVIFIYATIGTLNMADIAAKVHGIPFAVSEIYYKDLAMTTGIGLTLATWAFLVKAAVFPNHFWLPEAHPAAPTPISAVLSGLVVNVGVYSLLRFYTTLFRGTLDTGAEKVLGVLSTLLILLGAFSAIFAAVMMNIQKDIKRLIAYSTIVHMGYITAAIGVGTALSVEASLYHIINHAISKALMFLAAGVFIQMLGSRKIDDLAGIAKKAPVTAFAFAVSTFSLVGVPPMNVFYSKLLLYGAYVEYSVLLALVLVISSIIALIAYIRVLYKMLFERPTKEIKEREDTVMSLVCLVLAIVVIVTGILAPLLYQNVIKIAASQALDYTSYVNAIRDLIQRFF
ncbi:MAG: cation:proton antiporter [Euryarchaeota archaeon]|nr:cation:proton antiporter [Euryarchaeota archaeon]